MKDFLGMADKDIVKFVEEKELARNNCSLSLSLSLSLFLQLDSQE